MGKNSGRVWAWLSLIFIRGGVNIQTDRQWYGPTQAGGDQGYILRANLSLDAILGRVCFNAPGSVIWKAIAYNPYLGGALGLGWQTWSHITHNVNFNNDAFQPQNISFFKSKTLANLVWMGDVGIKLRRVIPNINFSVCLGAKFIGWGQARNIGLISQQKNISTFGMLRPFRSQLVYSIVPYMGFVWSF